MNLPTASNPATVRTPAAAGRFYPAQPEELRRMINDLLDRIQPDGASVPKAIIAPHAGYLYSGPVAASAYAQLRPARQIINRIILLGPSHAVAFNGLAASSASFFATPLGLVPVDTETVHRLRLLPQVSLLDEAHADEHSLEVHLPFLQVVLDDFKIVPLLAGDVGEEEVAEVIEAMWAGPETRFVISSDLSHYQDYRRALELDSATSRAIEGLRTEDIAAEQACGRTTVCGLLRFARRRGLRARTVDLRNSGDTAGPRGHVVGYGAFVFEETAGQRP